MTQHLGSDFDEIRLEVAAVPLGKHLGDLRGFEAAHVPQQIVGLADELHIGVLDTVVHHFYKMTGAVGADMGHTRFAIFGGAGRDRFEDGAEGAVRVGGAARHNRGAVQRALFTTRNTGAHKVQTACTHRSLPADCVGVERITAVDNDVARLKHLTKLINHRIRGVAGLHHDDRGAGSLQCGSELFEGVRGNKTGFGMRGNQRVGAFGGAVVNCHGITVAGGEVASQI